MIFYMHIIAAMEPRQQPIIKIEETKVDPYSLDRLNESYGKIRIWPSLFAEPWARLGGEETPSLEELCEYEKESVLSGMGKKVSSVLRFFLKEVFNLMVFQGKYQESKSVTSQSQLGIEEGVRDALNPRSKGFVERGYEVVTNRGEKIVFLAKIKFLRVGSGKAGGIESYFIQKQQGIASQKKEPVGSPVNENTSAHVLGKIRGWPPVQMDYWTLGERKSLSPKKRLLPLKETDPMPAASQDEVESVVQDLAYTVGDNIVLSCEYQQDVPVQEEQHSDLDKNQKALSRTETGQAFWKLPGGMIKGACQGITQAGEAVIVKCKIKFIHADKHHSPGEVEKYFLSRPK